MELSKSKLDQKSVAFTKDGDIGTNPEMESATETTGTHCEGPENEHQETESCSEDREEDRQGKANDDTVCVPISVINSLVTKIEALTKLIMEQKKEILDVEKRLKMEYRQREKNMKERVESLVCVSHSAQVVEPAPKASRQDLQRKKKSSQKLLKSEVKAQCEGVSLNFIGSENDTADQFADSSLANKNEKLIESSLFTFKEK